MEAQCFLFVRWPGNQHRLPSVLQDARQLATPPISLLWSAPLMATYGDALYISGPDRALLEQFALELESRNAGVEVDFRLCKGSLNEPVLADPHSTVGLVSIGLTADCLGDELAVAADFSACQGVLASRACYGADDLLLILMADNDDQFRQRLVSEIRPHRGVARTSTRLRSAIL